MPSLFTSERKICRVIHTPNPLMPAVIPQWTVFIMHTHFGSCGPQAALFTFLEDKVLSGPLFIIFYSNLNPKVYIVLGNVTDICALLARFNSCSSRM